FSSWQWDNCYSPYCYVNSTCDGFYDEKWYTCCYASGIGDGWCDLNCNVTELNHDGGDCLFCSNEGWCP
ncbi:unnamed protein product, partial [Heterosigma akashiwo]